jgi:predicted TIM-barrel fold metal-dependent hydrolase
MRSVLFFTLVAGCGAAAPALERNQIFPLVEHHQHLVGPSQIEPPEPSLPVIELPPELDRVLRDREKVSGKTAETDLYTQDAFVLDVSRAEDHWVRGRAAAHKMASAYTTDTVFLPNVYAVDGNTGYIAGIVRTGTNTFDDMHFTFGLRRDAGVWRIAMEYATNKPPRTFSEPITADRLIALLDEAGIQRAVVLSVAYWIASPLRENPVENEQAKLREANDWTIAEVAKYPGRLVAFCSVNPLRDYAIQEITRCAKLPGVKGVKLHFGNSAIDLKNPAHVATMRRFFRAANDLGLAITAHLWTLDKSYGAEHSKVFLEELLPEAPDVVVQIAHMGGGGHFEYDDVLGVFADAITAKDARMKHVYFDLTTVVDEGLPEAKVQLLARRLRQVGLERILFGADTPLPTRPSPLVAWATFRRRIPLTDAELRTIANNVAPYLR